mgnify:CR=1 FL=1
MRFDAAGNVAGIDRAGMERVAKLDPDGHKTETLGKNRGFLEDLFGYGGHYEEMGNFTYTVDVNGPQGTWSNSANLSHTPGINDTITVNYGGATYHFTPTQEP